MDRTTDLISAYACDLTYDQLPADVVHQVKHTLIDSAGCLIGGLQSEPARVARHLASNVTCTNPSRLLGTAQGSSPDDSTGRYCLDRHSRLSVRHVQCGDRTGEVGAQNTRDD